MKTAKEIMEEHHLTKSEYANSEGGSYFTVENIEAAMEKYADQFKVKNLAQPDVSGQLLSFFLWFRANGELHIDKSIEAMIEIYLKESNLRQRAGR